jgi:hypothetical protein
MKKKVENETTKGKKPTPIPFREYFGKNEDKLIKVMEKHNVPTDEYKKKLKELNKPKRKSKKEK